MSTMRRKLATTAATAGLLTSFAGYTLRTAPPAAATASAKDLGGNFIGGDETEVFFYQPGTASDILWEDFSTDGSFTYAVPHTFSITGDYVPLVGDFDGDGYDEIFFYGAGPGNDVIWHFDSATTRTQTQMTVSGLYNPAVGDYTGDGVDDILWYAPGSAGDSIWDFKTDTDISDGYTWNQHIITNITGSYAPLTGNFTGDGAEDFIMYGAGTTADWRYDCEPGTNPDCTNTAYGPINGATHLPFTLDGYGDGWTDIFWYNPGTTADVVWNYTALDTYTPINETVDGTLRKTTGDLFGDGYDDIFWHGSTTMVWDYHLNESGQIVHRELPLGASFAAALAAAEAT